jgi:dTMP kinase
MAYTIAIEGVDNLGKTTVAQNLVRTFVEDGYQARIEPEFGNDILGNTIRHLVENHWEQVPLNAQALIIAADRFHRYLSIAQREHSSREIIVFDRHLFSTEVYQSIALGISVHEIKEMLQSIYGRMYQYPQLTFILDAPIETSVERGGDDIHSVDFLSMARKLYLDYASRTDVIIVDARQNTSDTVKFCRKKILSLASYGQR